MPDIKLLKLPSSEGAFLQDGNVSAQTVCSSRRRSCALVNTPTPCVRKAVCHIQELRTKLEGQKGGNAQHETENENNHSNIWKCVPSSDGRDEDVTAELCIEGLGFCAEGSELLTPRWKETVDVLAEVMCLMERLELDRRDAEKALLEEKEKAKKLVQKQDSLAHWEQQEFPIAMEKERDACCPDIAELTWRLKTRRDQQPQVRDRLTRAEMLNRRLNEDIDFMREHGPLVEERLRTEEEIMKHIRTTESQTRETLTNVSQELKDFQLEFKEEQIRADTEKHNTNKDIQTLKNHLSDKLSELHQLQSQCEIFHRSIKKSQEKVTLRDSQIKAVLQEIRQFERQRANRNDAVMTLKERIEDKEEIFTTTNKQLLQLQTQIQTTKGEGDEKVSGSNALLSQKRRDLLALRAENEERTLEIEDYKKKIRQSEHAATRLQKDRKRLMLKINLNEEQRKEAEDELERVSDDHACTKNELGHLERLTYLEELGNRKQIEVMRIQIADEMKTFDILKGDIATAAAELSREQTQCERAKIELQKKFEDASSTTAQLEAKVEKLRQNYTEKSQTIESLKAKLCDVHAAHEHLSDEFEKKKGEHQTCLKSVKDVSGCLDLTSEKMSNRIKELRLKSEGLRKASDMMEKTASAMPDIIEELKSLLDTAAFKHGTATVVLGHLRKDVTSCEERKCRRVQVHSVLFAQRRAVMKDIEVIFLTCKTIVEDQYLEL
ncbi:coiled-coil domain-containing protein 178 isoform X1 [Triplophysa rosa]|uniref:coiled-coil domain-containing protein 178 isoform X1 n=1 Tax=Triplophysa rosa TaxID=992332 RepID=UPI0025461059|nr:coiled-coil domain-containing protein 178 isoform X1 [Triplophysa rosa]